MNRRSSREYIAILSRSPSLINSAGCGVQFSISVLLAKNIGNHVIWNRWGRLFFPEISCMKQNNNLCINYEASFAFFETDSLSLSPLSPITHNSSNLNTRITSSVSFANEAVDGKRIEILAKSLCVLLP